MNARAILAVVAPLVAVYLLGAFVAWDFDAGHWDALGRCIVAAAGAWSVGMSIAFERGAL